MSEAFRKIALSSFAVALLALPTSSAQAVTFLGLDSTTGDLIDSLGFTIAAGGGNYVDATNQFDMTGAADNLDATPTAPPGAPKVLTEIAGGVIDVNLDVVNESLTYLGASGANDFFRYIGTLSGRGGEADVSIFSPFGGLPEQDGRLLIEGEMTSSAMLDVVFSTTIGVNPTISFTGEFQVVDGDSTFQQAFGTNGDLGDIFTTTTSSTPPTLFLLADGFVFSDRDDGAAGNVLATCALLTPGSTCTGVVTGQTADFTFEGNGEIIPQNSAPFVPEPGTGLMVSVGLALVAAHRRQRRSRTGRGE